MRQWVAAIAVVTAAASAIEPARASMFCSEPSKPYRDGSGFFDDESEFERCKSEVESDVDDVKRYTECLSQAADDAIRESNDVVDKFNCRAKGGSVC